MPWGMQDQKPADRKTSTCTEAYLLSARRKANQGANEVAQMRMTEPGAVASVRGKAREHRYAFLRSSHSRE